MCLKTYAWANFGRVVVDPLLEQMCNEGIIEVRSSPQGRMVRLLNRPTKETTPKSAGSVLDDSSPFTDNPEHLEGSSGKRPHATTDRQTRNSDARFEQRRTSPVSEL